MRQKIRWFAFLLTISVVVVVAFQNHHPVDVKLLFFSGRYPLTLVLLATAAISFVLGALMTAWRLRQRGKAARPSASRAAARSNSSASPPSP